MKRVKRVDTIYRVAREKLKEPEIKRRVSFGSFFVVLFISLVALTISLVPTWSSLSNAGELPAPDFSADKITRVKAGSPDIVAVQVQRNKDNELWLYGVANNVQKNIGFGADVNPDIPVAIKDGYVFWVSEDKKSLFIFDSKDDKRLQQEISFPDGAKGERTRVKIWGISWDIVVAPDNIYFSSKKTGELFSDDSSEALNLFRTKFGLDQMLTEDELENSGFVTERNE